MVGSRRFTETDLAVSKKISTIRRSKGIRCSELAAVLEVSLQQYNKYEKGVNRLSASSLFKIANCLDVSVEKFFEPLTKNEKLISEYGELFDSILIKLHSIKGREKKERLLNFLEMVKNS